MQNFFKKLGKVNVFPFLNDLPKEYRIKKENFGFTKNKTYTEYISEEKEEWFYESLSIVASLYQRKYPEFKENILKKIRTDNLKFSNFGFHTIPKTIKVYESIQFNSCGIYFDEIITPKLNLKIFSSDIKSDIKIKCKTFLIEKTLANNIKLDCELAIINNSLKIDPSSKIKNLLITKNQYNQIDIPTNFVFSGDVKLTKNSTDLLENVIINGNFDISETSLLYNPLNNIIVHGDIIMNNRQKKIFKLNNLHNKPI